MDIIPSFSAWFDERLNAFDAVVFDVDGVLVHGREAIEGAPAVIRRMQHLGKPFTILTNDGSGSVAQKQRLLKHCGMDVLPEQIVSCSHGLEEVVQDRRLQGERFFVMGKLGEPCYGVGAGLRITRDLGELPVCAGVIVGELDYDWEPTLNAVVNALLRKPDTLLVVPNPDQYFADGEGGIVLAAGAVGRFIQTTLAYHDLPHEPVFLGKPYRPIFEHNRHVLEKNMGRTLPPDRVVILGDSLASDIRGGNEFGYRTALLLTGVTRPDMLERSPVQPDMVFARL